jgi:hypothetical protein
MGINEAVTAIEDVLRTYDGGGKKPTSVQVRPSGDDLDVIKIWIDLGDSGADTDAWTTACEAAIRKAVPGAAAFKLQIRAE